MALCALDILGSLSVTEQPFASEQVPAQYYIRTVPAFLAFRGNFNSVVITQPLRLAASALAAL